MSLPAAPFGRVLTAMVTPFTADGSVDLDGRRARWPTYLVEHGNDGVVVSGTTGEAPTTSVAEDGEILRAVDRRGRRPVHGGRGRRHQPHRALRRARPPGRRRSAPTACSLVSPYYNKPTQAGIAAHFEAVAAASDLRIMLYDIPGRTGVTIAPETFARIAAEREVRGGQGRRRRPLPRREDHAGDRAELLQRRRRAQPRLADPRRRRSGLGGRPRRRASSTPTWWPGSTPATSTAPCKVYGDLVPVVDAIMGQAPGVMTAKAAMELLGVHDNRAVRLPLVEADDALVDVVRTALDRGRPSPLSHPHPELSAPPALPTGGLRVIPLGGLGEVGRNMTVFEYDGRLLIVDCGVLFPEENHPGVDLILPDFDAIRDRLDDVDALVLTHGHEDHIGAVPYLLRERSDIPLVGSQLTLALIGSKLREHRIKDTVQEIVAEGDRITLRALRPRVRRGQPLDPRRAGRRDPHRRRHGAAHRRLQDGPAPARRPHHRPARVRPARRGGRRPVPHRLHQRRGPRLHDLGEGDLAGPRAGLPHQQEAHHRGLLRLPRAPRAAGDGRRRRARPQGGLRRALDGAQHGHRPRPRLPRRTSRAAHRRQGHRRHAARPGGADLHRLPGRAALGAEPDRAAQPQLRAHRGGRHRRPRLAR